MRGPTAPPDSIAFAAWELRPAERRLLVDGSDAPVGGRAFDVLLALARRPGELVTKDELLAQAWPGLVVEENNISVQIAALRKLLGPKAIRTIAGSGYVLAAPATASAPARGAPGADAPPPGLLGRDADWQALHGRVGQAALVSLVGPGGVGKTTLARALLAAPAGPGPEGRHWIELAPERDGARLPGLVAKALGIELGSGQPLDELLSAMAPLRALVALDNCEHLHAKVAAFLRRALDAAPGVRWLVTSQRPLRVAGETVHRLEPLAVPAADAGLEAARSSSAAMLLCRCAQAADHRFALTAANVADVVDICRRLDGLPLAIEMAAARVATLGLQAVRQRLGQRLRLLAGHGAAHQRQHALRSAFDWSHGLLAPTEQRVFRRLQPFLGGFTAAMALAVVADPGDAEPLDEWQVLDALGALVEQSLLQRSADEPPRFHLLESARDYAHERLAEAGEASTVLRRHAEAVAVAMAPAFDDAERLRDDEWLRRYAPERFNVSAALNWAIAAREPELLARGVSALAQIDAFIGGRAEIVHLPLPLDVLMQAPPAARGEACLFASWCHYTDGNRETGAWMAQQAVADLQALGHAAGTYRALAQLIRLYESRPGTLALAQQAWQQWQALDPRGLPLRTRLFCAISAGLQYEAGRSATPLEELEDLARRAGFNGMAASCRAHIVDELLIERRFDEAVVQAERFLALGPMRPRTRARILMNQTLALVELGRIDEAFAAAGQAVRTHPGDTARVVDLLALAAARQGRAPEAAQMAGFCARVRRERDEKPDPAEARVIEQTWSLLAAQLRPARLEELVQMGAGMPQAEVLALALPAPELTPPRGAAA